MAGPSRLHPAAKGALAALVAGGLACVVVFVAPRRQSFTPQDTRQRLLAAPERSLTSRFEAAPSGHQFDAVRPAWLEDDIDENFGRGASARRLHWCINLPDQEACNPSAGTTAAAPAVAATTAAAPAATTAAAAAATTAAAAATTPAPTPLTTTAGTATAGVTTTIAVTSVGSSNLTVETTTATTASATTPTATTTTITSTTVAGTTTVTGTTTTGTTTTGTTTTGTTTTGTTTTGTTVTATTTTTPTATTAAASATTTTTTTTTGTTTTATTTTATGVSTGTATTATATTSTASTSTATSTTVTTATTTATTTTATTVTATTVTATTVTTTTPAPVITTAPTTGNPPCYLCPGFPVGSCQTIADGATCEANTINHPCVGSGALRFTCPSSSTATRAYSQTLSIGSHWGAGAYFQLWSGDLGYDGNGVRKRNAELVSMAGNFDVKCRVCGLGTVSPVDTDARAEYVAFTVEFGPNILNGVVDESGIIGYRVYLASNCSSKLTHSLAFVSKSNNGHSGTSVSGMCGCPASTYSVQVVAHLPPGVDEGKLMILPVTTGGYELPVGTMSGTVQDYKGVTTTLAPQAVDHRTTVQLTGDVYVRIGCQYAPDYISRPEVKAAWHQTMSDYTKVPREYIEVILRNNCPARRLQSSQGTVNGQVIVAYIISFPPSVQSDPNMPQAAALEQTMTAHDVLYQLSQTSSAYVDQQMAGTGVTYNTVVVGVNAAQSTAAEDSVDKGLIAGIVIGSVSFVWVVLCVLYCLICSKRKEKQEEAQLTGTL